MFHAPYKKGCLSDAPGINLHQIHPSGVITLRALMFRESFSSSHHPKIGCLRDVFSSCFPYTQSSIPCR